MLGKLIAFEGVDAVGKSTHTARLMQKLEELGHDTLFLKFPTYDKTPYGKLVQDYLQGRHGEKEKTSAYVASMMYALDRMQFRERISKQLRGGTIIVCDRWKASNAFQIAKEPERKWRELFDWLQRLEAPLPDADATVWLDVPPEKAFHASRGDKKDIYEKDLEYQKKVRRVYEWMSEFLPIIHVRVFRGDRPRSVEEVFAEIWGELEERRILG